MIWLVLLFLLMCAALVACVFEGAIRAEMYPPEAADDPGLDCGCAIGSVVIGCMVCSRTSCPAHQVHDHADPVDEVHDGWQRAKYFTGEEAATPQVAAQAPAVVAGSDLDRHRMSKAEACLRLRLMVDADDALRDLRELPHDLAPLYVVPKVER